MDDGPAVTFGTARGRGRAAAPQTYADNVTIASRELYAPLETLLLSGMLHPLLCKYNRTQRL